MEQFQVTEDKVVPVQITVVRGKHLKGSKSESFHNFVRAEFNDTLLGDSPKLIASTGQGVDYNFTCSFECSEAAHTLDDLANKPVVLTVMEIFPKEKEHKEEKTSVLGQAVVDLLPLLQGQCSFTTAVPLHPVPGSPGETATLEGSHRPALDVTICVPEALLSDVQLSDSNLLRVAVETAYSVPEVWSTGPGPPSSYKAALPVPLSPEKDQVLLFSNGVLKMGGEREPLPRPKKWPVGPLLAPGAQFMPGVYIEGEPVEMEDGELTGIEDREFRKEAETNRKRVSWDTERRCFMEAGAVACLIRRIVECRLWPVEVMRSTQLGAAKGAKMGKEKQVDEETAVPFHGVAYVDMAPLLYPGVRRIRGAYPLCPFYDSDLQAKAKRNASVLRETTRASARQGKGRVTSSLESTHCKAAPSKTFAKEPKEVPKKPGTQGKVLSTECANEVDAQVNLEGQMYTEARSYIVIEMALEKPLVPKRPLEELARRVMDLVPPRPPLPPRPTGAERAMQDYHAQIASVAGQVLGQYQQLFGAALAPGSQGLDPATQEQRKTQLVGELNYSGKYFAFKEQMKHSVVRIVREKMLRTEAFTDPEKLQAFLSQLYVFLVDQMHIALNKTLSEEAQEEQTRLLLDCSQLKHFAREAQLNQDYQLAAKYYQECLARNRRDPSHWFDYGAFHMLTRDYLKAGECFQQAVSIDRAHLPSLLMCGILAEMNGRNEDAETFFEGATCVAPSSVVAWTLFGLFYEGVDNTIQAEMAFLEAERQLTGTLPPSEEPGAREALETASTQADPEGHAETLPMDSRSSPGIRAPGAPDTGPNTPRALHSPSTPNTTSYMVTVQFLLQNYALQMAQRALAQELLCPEGGVSSSYHYALARLQMLRGEFSSAETSLKEALNDSIENPDMWALSGHLHYLTGNHSEAQKCYERTLDLVTDASDTHPVYLRLGAIYQQEGQFEKAKITYLRACKSSPSCLTWLGLGVACYRLGELTEAEDALTEANTLDNENPEVWGYLSLLCLQTGRRLEAEQSYKYAIKLDLRKEKLLQEIHELQAQVGFGNPCF